MSSTTLGICIAVASAVGFGMLPVFIKIAYNQQVNTSTLLFLRFMISSILLFGYIRYQRKSFSIPREKILPIIALGAIGFGASSCTFTLSTKYLSASLASIIFQIYPALVAIASFAFGLEQISMSMIVAFVSCFIGLIMVIGPDFSTMQPIGLLFAVLASVSYALYILAGTKVKTNIDTVVLTFYITLSAAITFLFSGLFQGDLHLDLSIYAWLNMLGMSLFGTVIGILGFLAALRYITATHACIVSTCEPLITVFAAVLLLGEHLSVMQLLGGLMVIGSILLLELRRFFPIKKK